MASLATAMRHSSRRRCGMARIPLWPRRGYFTSPDDNLSEQTSDPAWTALVVGSSGALGSVVANHLTRQLGMQVIGADVRRSDGDDASSSSLLHAFVPLPQTNDLPELCAALADGLDHVLRKTETRYRKRLGKDHGGGDSDDTEGIGLLDAVVCANGGWQGDVAVTKRGGERDAMMEGAHVLQHMLQVNLHPVLATAHVVLQGGRCAPVDDTLCVVMGATPALLGTPGMLGYGASKAAVHHVVATLGGHSTQTLGKKHKAQNNSGGAGGRASPSFPATIGILPTTLNTPGNRASLSAGKPVPPSWTKCEDVAAQIGTWFRQPSLRPAAGSLVKVRSNAHTGEAFFEMVR